MLCPVDHSELLVDSVDGYRVHRCAQCFGVALSGNLLREVRGEQWARLSEIVGPPLQADLSGVVQNLTTTATYGTFGLWYTLPPPVFHKGS
jgi:hypothetical protein